jgi:methionyl-tRNA formyltransferase
MLFSMASLRVVFAGTPQNAADTLEVLVDRGVNVVGVLTRQDAPVGRTKELTPSPVAIRAESLGLHVYKSNSLDNKTLEWLDALSADIGAVVAFGSIFKQQVLDVPRLGWLNLHYSLLPELPGPAPVQHAILEGRSQTGVTVFRLDAGIDTGPIVASTNQDIEDTDTACSLLVKLTRIGALLLSDVLLADEIGLASARKQERNAISRVATKPTRDLARIDFGHDSRSLANKIRAMNPEPMAWFEFNETAVRVIQARVAASTSDIALATIVDKELVVGCIDGSLVLEIIQPAGKQPMSGADWFRGLRVDQLMLS